MWQLVWSWLIGVRVWDSLKGGFIGAEDGGEVFFWGVTWSRLWFLEKKKKKTKQSKPSVTKCRSYSILGLQVNPGPSWICLQCLAGDLTSWHRSQKHCDCISLLQYHQTRSALGQIKFIPRLWNCVWQCWLLFLSLGEKRIFTFHFPDDGNATRYSNIRYLRIKIDSSDGSQN